MECTLNVIYAQLIIMFIYINNTGRTSLENGPDELIVTLYTKIYIYPSKQTADPNPFRDTLYLLSYLHIK